MMMETRNYTTETNALTITATSGGASANNVYTCPLNYDATVEFLHVSNGSNSTKNFTIEWYHADKDTYHPIINDKSISGNDVYNIVTSDRIHLHAGDKIGAFDGTSGQLEIFISIRQYYNPNR